MVFSSLTFLLYFLPIALIGYFLLSFSTKAQNVWLFLVSILFYAWGEPSFVIILLISIFINWLMGILVGINKDKNVKAAKIFVFVDVAVNIGLLFCFKYLSFVIDTVNSVARTELINDPKLPLPIGISFFTFQSLSYVVDVYRGDAKIQKNILNLGLYIAFFPQLIAGPIVRYNTIEQFIYSRKFDVKNITLGVNRFALGLVKKVLLANNLAILADTIFDLIGIGTKYDVPMLMAWIGIIGYYYQLFFDFSAYSDMAIGLGRIFGFEFEENFNYPYISKSIGEQWRRWHISLGTWFKEYVYYPLGGSRVKNDDMMVRNTIIVWILTGIWHGASWTYVMWGLMQFTFIMLERVCNYEKLRIPGWIKVILAQFAFGMSLVVFRSESLYILKEASKDLLMLNGNSLYNDASLWIIREYWFYIVLAAFFATPIAANWWKKVLHNEKKSIMVCANIGYSVLLMAGVFLSILFIVRGSYNPFIYFNF